MTYGAMINTSNGNIAIDTTEMDEDDIQDQQAKTQAAKQNMSSGEKSYLANKFFELNL
jgi:hypothetical protein